MVTEARPHVSPGIYNLPSQYDRGTIQEFNRITQEDAFFLTGIAIHVASSDAFRATTSISSENLRTMVDAAFAAREYKSALHFMINLLGRFYIENKAEFTGRELSEADKFRVKRQSKEVAGYLRHYFKEGKIFNPPAHIIMSKRTGQHFDPPPAIL